MFDSDCPFFNAFLSMYFAIKNIGIFAFAEYSSLQIIP